MSLNVIFVVHPEWRFTIVEMRDTVMDVPSAVFPDELVRESSRSPSAGGSALEAYADTVLAGMSRNDRRTLLESLESRIREGRMYGNVAAVRSVLIDLVGESLDRSGRFDDPAIRRDAARLLGLIGDLPSRDALSQAVRYDPDATVVAAALTSVTSTGKDAPDTIIHGLRRFETGTAAERRVIGTALLQGVVRVVPDRRGRGP